MMDDRRKSDTAVVPEKSRNAADGSTADATKGRAVAKGKPPERNVLRTQSRAGAPSAVKAELRQRLHQPVPEQGAYLRAVILAHNRYYGVPMNGPGLSAFREAMVRLWWRGLRRRTKATI